MESGWEFIGGGFYIRRLGLLRFRNFLSFHHGFDSGCVLLTGANGVGKTNILEAISLLSGGRGLRSARVSDLRYWGADEDDFGVSFHLSDSVVFGDSGVSDIMRVSVIGDSGGRKRFKKNGEFLSRQEDLSYFTRVVWLLPHMERVFFSSRGARRSLLDGLTAQFDIAHRRRCSDYEKLMRDRFRLLREGGDAAWISVLESRMAALGVAIVAARNDLVGRLNRLCYGGDERFPYGVLQVGGLLEDCMISGSALAAEASLREHLCASRSRDRDSGMSSVGPNCSAVDIILHRRGDSSGGVSVDYCSAGENRLLLLSLIISQAYLLAREYGRAPLLLLDEVCVHLDRRWREVLCDIISRYPGQCWLTATDNSAFRSLGDDYLEVSIGEGV